MIDTLMLIVSITGLILSLAMWYEKARNGLLLVLLIAGFFASPVWAEAKKRKQSRVYIGWVISGILGGLISWLWMTF